MGLNTAVLCVQGEDEAWMLRALAGWEPTGHVVPADLVGAALQAGPAVGTTGGWTFVIDPGLGLAFDPVNAALASRGGRGIAAVWQSATDTHAFDVYEDGLRTRGQVRMAGTLIVDDGSPIPEEEGLAWDDDAEEALARLVSRVSGIDLLGRDFLEVPVHPLRRRPTLR